MAKDNEVACIYRPSCLAPTGTTVLCGIQSIALKRKCTRLKQKTTVFAGDDGRGLIITEVSEAVVNYSFVIMEGFIT